MRKFYAKHYSKVNKSIWRWKSFSPRELASRGNGGLDLDIEAVDRLQFLRDTIGKPLIINSAYRDPIYNARVGGAPRSQHKLGKAFDISLRNHDLKELYFTAKKCGFTGFGFYSYFLHVDTGRRREWGNKPKNLRR